MMNLEYHKGSFCSYISAFCQEGYRVGCETCLKSRLYSRREKPETKVNDVRKSQEMTVVSMHS
jgi:hypothetical protein